MTKTNIFISFSQTSSGEKKLKLEEDLKKANYAVNYSEKEDRSNQSDDTIWKYLKGKISGSSVMILLFSWDLNKGHGGKAEKESDNANPKHTEFHKQGWIYKEIKCALRESTNNNINGIIVVMPDDIYDSIYENRYCHEHRENTITLDRSKYPDILLNNYINKKKSKKYNSNYNCCFDILHDSFIPIVKESKFMKYKKYYIDIVKEKRNHINEYNIVKEV